MVTVTLPEIYPLPGSTILKPETWSALLTTATALAVFNPTLSAKLLPILIVGGTVYPNPTLDNTIEVTVPADPTTAYPVAVTNPDGCGFGVEKVTTGFLFGS